MAITSQHITAYVAFMTTRVGRPLVRARAGRRGLFRQRGQIAPALSLTALCSFSALALNSASDSSTRLYDQLASDAAMSSAAHVWSTEAQQLPLTTAEATGTSGVAMTAQEVADVNGVTTNQGYYCQTNTSSQFDEIFWDTANGGTAGQALGAGCSAPANFTYSFEVQIPPIMGALPSKCSPTYTCVAAVAGQKVTNILGQTLGANQTTVSSTTIAFGCNGTGAAPTPANVQMGPVVTAPVAYVLTVSLPAPSTAGTMLLISWTTASATAITVPTLWSSISSGSNGALAGFFYYPNNPGSIQTVTMNCPTSPCYGQISEWSNVKPASPKDKTGGNGDAVSHTSETATTCCALTTAGDLAVTMFYPASGGTETSFTPGAGWTNLGQLLTAPVTSDYELNVAALNPVQELEGWAPTASSLNEYSIATFKKNVSAIAKVQAGAMVAGSVSGYPSVTLTLPVASTAGTLLVATFVTPVDMSMATGWDSYQAGDCGGGCVGTSGWYVHSANPGGITSLVAPCGNSPPSAPCSGQISEWSGTGTGFPDGIDSSPLACGGCASDAASHTSETATTTTAHAGDLALTIFYPRTAGSEASFTRQGGWANVGHSLTVPYTSDWQVTALGLSGHDRG